MGTDESRWEHLRAAMEAMAEAKAPAFNARTPDDSSVDYQSWAGVSSMGGRADERQYVLGVCENKVANVLPGTFDRMRIEFIAFEKIVTHGYSQPSDGMVTVASAKWGNFMGCVPGDHSDEIGRMTTSRPNPRTSWDPQRFWRGVAFDLSAKGF